MQRLGGGEAGDAVEFENLAPAVECGRVSFMPSLFEGTCGVRESRGRAEGPGGPHHALQVMTREMMPAACPDGRGPLLGARAGYRADSCSARVGMDLGTEVVVVADVAYAIHRGRKEGGEVLGCCRGGWRGSARRLGREGDDLGCGITLFG